MQVLEPGLGIQEEGGSVPWLLAASGLPGTEQSCFCSTMLSWYHPANQAHRPNGACM
jgi:hypothetical protein